MPKKDWYTNTVEDAAEFEKYYNSEPPDDEYDNYDEYCYEDENSYYDSCKCSDPCCPCSGNKVGIP